MKQSAKPHTSDLFAARDAAPACAPSWKAGGIPPTPRKAGSTYSKQLGYAAVFPELPPDSAAVLRRLCMHAQRFTSLVSVEPPNAVLLEIKGSLKLFGPVERLHAGIDACWRGLEQPAHSATAPSTLAALWLARGAAANGAVVQIEDLGTLAGHLAKLPIACTAWDAELEPCNLGYAQACPRFPKESPADAVRFAVSKYSPERLLVQFSLESKHLPAGHGCLEYDRIAAGWMTLHSDSRIQKLADCFLQSYLERAGR